jgi:hypothetical protein
LLFFASGSSLLLLPKHMMAIHLRGERKIRRQCRVRLKVLRDEAIWSWVESSGVRLDARHVLGGHSRRSAWVVRRARVADWRSRGMRGVWRSTGARLRCDAALAFCVGRELKLCLGELGERVAAGGTGWPRAGREQAVVTLSANSRGGVLYQC